MNPSDADLEQSRTAFFEGLAHFEAGRLAPARACFERCQALTPGRPSVLGNLGLVQEAQGHWAAAAQALEQALALADGSAPQWLALARCRARLGQHADALAALERALALDATLAQAWSLRGNLQRELQQLDAAAHSYEQAIAHGAERELHAYYLAAVRGAEVPAQAPRHYVEALFDDYAADFQAHLARLGYRGHEQLLQPIVASGRRFRHALDLGCGTGLCGQLLAPRCERIDGVDLSGAMLVQARTLGVYRELVHADIGAYLAAATQRVDLVVAADVMIYVGALDGVLREVARLLEPGGLFAFTLELSSDGQALQLLPSLRYAHSEASVRELAAACGLMVDDLRHAPIRHEQGQPVAGLYLRLRK